VTAFADLNWLAIFVAALAYFLLGALWYGPFFGKIWAAGMNIDPTQGGSMAAGYAITFVGNLLLATVFARILSLAPATGDALMLAFWLWLGFVATTLTITALWDSRPRAVAAINVGYHLAGMLVAALVLSMWPA
jgi:hypothetical protein